jgi:AcrR family transcriptional regulator
MIVSVNRQEGTLARTYEDEPGLPRGRSRLPAETVRAAQRERLLRAVIAAVAETGFHQVTVAAIVRRAKVSRAAFYAHFAGKEDCFLAASVDGGMLMAGQVVRATRALPAGTPAEEVLRAGIAAYLKFLADEPAFARAFYIEMPAAGARAAEWLEIGHHRYARLNRAWQERARRDNPAWPDLPYDAYYALSGATTELVRAQVRVGRTHTLTCLEDTLAALHLAVLAARPWPRTDAGSE